MANIKAAIAAHLKNDAGVSALVGTRVYRGFAPSNATLPRIVFDRDGDDRVRHMGGSSNLTVSPVQIDCYGDNDADAEAVAEAVVAAMEGTRGTLGSTPNTITLRGAKVRHLPDSFIKRDKDGSEDGTYAVSQDWTFSHDNNET